MSNDTFLTIAFSLMIGMFALMLIIGIPRGKRMQKTNEKIAANQAKQIELNEQMQRRQLEFQERQMAAMERIATAQERRGE